MESTNKVIDYLYSREFEPYYYKDDNREIVMMTEADERHRIMWMNTWLSIGYGFEIKEDSEERIREYTETPPRFIPVSDTSVSKEEAAEINNDFILKKCLFKMALQNTPQ